MAIIWRKEMSVNNDAIDHDHHFMVNFLNTVELALQTPQEKDILLEVFEQLYDYSVYHFRREESIQRKIEYPSSLKHKSSHANLLKQLEELKLKIKKSKSSEEITKQADEINIFLKGWLINHVLNEDFLLKPYLSQHPRGLT